MRNTIKTLKRLVSEMESYVYCSNYDKVNQLANELLNLTKIIKEQSSTYGNDNNKTINDYPGFTSISTLSFLYKPIEVKNYFDGNYLERFGERRTEDLKDAKALELHNKFWMSNSVESGNVFGSIPLELISKDTANILRSRGWETSEVTIYEVEEEMSQKELDEFCDRIFSHYIIATEMRNKTKLVLKYDI